MNYAFSKATFHPWIGKAYGEAHFGLKLLILGESHYSWPGHPTDLSRITRDALTWGREEHRFWKGLEKLIPEPGGKGTPRGWDSVAFYNFIQHLVGDGPRQRPEVSMWTSEETLSGFKEVLEVCKPDRILIVGKNNWRLTPGGRELPDHAPVSEPRFGLPESFTETLEYDVEKFARWYPVGDGSFALAAPIYHPAYPKGFHAPETIEVVSRLLDPSWESLKPLVAPPL